MPSVSIDWRAYYLHLLYVIKKLFLLCIFELTSEYRSTWRSGVRALPAVHTEQKRFFPAQYYDYKLYIRHKTCANHTQHYLPTQQFVRLVAYGEHDSRLELVPQNRDRESRLQYDRIASSHDNAHAAHADERWHRAERELGTKTGTDLSARMGYWNAFPGVDGMVTWQENEWVVEVVMTLCRVIKVRCQVALMCRTVLRNWTLLSRCLRICLVFSPLAQTPLFDFWNVSGVFLSTLLNSCYTVFPRWWMQSAFLTSASEQFWSVMNATSHDTEISRFQALI